MADVIREDKYKNLVLKIVTGSGASGNTYANRTLKHFNPNLSDDDFLVCGNGYASLQTYTLNSVNVVDGAVVVEE